MWPPSKCRQLSDAELIQQLADQAKELGIEIDLNYSFCPAKEGARQVTGLNQTLAHSEDWDRSWLHG
jgi:hypothetical protein